MLRCTPTALLSNWLNKKCHEDVCVIVGVQRLCAVCHLDGWLDVACRVLVLDKKIKNTNLTLLNEAKLGGHFLHWVTAKGSETILFNLALKVNDWLEKGLICSNIMKTNQMKEFFFRLFLRICFFSKHLSSFFFGGVMLVFVYSTLYWNRVTALSACSFLLLEIDLPAVCSAQTAAAVPQSFKLEKVYPQPWPSFLWLDAISSSCTVVLTNRKHYF